MNEMFAKINTFLQEYLVYALGVVLSAVIFYWFSYTALIDRVSATEVEVSRNQTLSQEIHGTLDQINTTLTNVAIDMAVIKEKVSSLEK